MLQVDICDSCAKDKRIVFIGKVKIYDRPERTTSLCQDCFSQKCFCSICFKRTSYSSYEKHLLKSHSSNQMALQLVNAKIFSDFMQEFEPLYKTKSCILNRKRLNFMSLLSYDKACHQNAKFINNNKDPEQMDQQAKLNKICLNPDCGHSWYTHWGKDHSLACMICFCPKFKI